MDKIELNRAKKFKGEFYPPPDKSISHRAVIFSSISKGRSIIKNFLRSEDTLSTVESMRMLGIEIMENGDESRFTGELIVEGKGLSGLKEPVDIINCKNSGTTIRLLSGVLSGNAFFSVLTGDDSLRKRPMSRVIIPLRQMGAEIMGREEDKYPPIAIRGGRLKPIKYSMPVASAQVKSALMLAGLYTEGETEIIEPFKSRDHTERMLPCFGAEIDVKGLHIRIKGRAELKSTEIYIPGDFSSAAFFIVAAILIPDSEVLVKNVGVNPTRTGLLEVLKKMGANIELTNIRDISLKSEPLSMDSGHLSAEPVADIYCKSCGDLRSINISRESIPALIDEFPIICVAATQAEGITTIRGAEELRLKESDRIRAMSTELKKMGAEIEEYEDGIRIKGKADLKGAILESYKDHRIAMALSIASLIADGTTTINNVSSVNISFPGFFDILRKLMS
ncbi:MAG: 3-phosphoshikimate 1-carboxyvinyltransferase [Thermodesulfovibrionales bacterium]